MVKHVKGMWKRAAEGAEVGAYVLANADGRRYQYDGPAGIDAVVMYDARESQRYYAAWIDADVSFLSDRYKRLPYFDGSKFLSKEDAFPFMIEEARNKIASGDRQAKYNETKKFPDLGRAKQRVLYLVGYYNQFAAEMGMLSNWTPVPPWGATWFIWSATKDGEIIEPVLNCAEYVAATQKYAELSSRFGPEAKEVFKKIEKADEPYEGVVVVGKFDDSDYYDDTRFVSNFGRQHDGQYIGEGAGYEFSPEEKKAIKALDFKVKKVGKTRAAFAAKTVGDAVMAKLAYTGGLDIKIIDMNTMEEHVSN